LNCVGSGYHVCSAVTAPMATIAPNNP
jgi:hypothetical protein